MRTAKSLDSAVDKGAFMVFADDWRGIKELDPDAIGRAMYLAANDSWSKESEDNIGNGFLCNPRNRIREIAKTEDGETVAIYTTLIRSNITARKTYIRGNRLLADAIGQLEALKSEDKVVAVKE